MIENIEGFNLIEHIIIGSIFKKIYSEKDYIKVSIRKGSYYILDPLISNGLILNTGTNSPCSAVKIINERKPKVKKLYHFTFEQLIEYVTGDYIYSIPCSAYLNMFLFGEFKDIYSSGHKILEKVSVRNDLDSNIRAIYNYLDIPIEIKRSIQYLICNYEDRDAKKFKGWFWERISPLEKLKIRNNYISNKEVIYNIEIDMLLDQYYKKHITKTNIRNKINNNRIIRN